jgi:HlyD family secretion protein
MTRGKKIAIAATGVLVIGALVAVNLKFERRKKVAVHTEKITRRDLRSVVTASGKIQPKRQVNISASTIGTVTRLAVAEGDTVEPGQFLLQIDPAPFAAQVAALRASIAAAQALRAQADANLQQARLDLQRLAELRRHDLATEQDVERARTGVEVETARVESARKEIERLEANLRSASHDLARVTFNAPLAGLITAMNIEEGENVVTGTMNNPGTVLMTIADLSEIEAEIEVDETDVVNIRPRQPAVVTIDAFPDRKFKGEVVKVGNSAILSGSGLSASDQTTNFKVTVALREPVPGVKPSLSCSSDITTATRDDVLAVPIQSLTLRTLPEPKKREGGTRAGDPETARGVQAAPERGEPAEEGEEDEETREKSRKEREKEGVFVVRDGKAVFVPVKTGISGERFFEVLEGLREGDEVVTGTYQAIRDLKDGDFVKVEKKPEKER